MPDGGAGASQMTDGAKVDAGADMVDHPGGEVGILFRIVDQESHLGQGDSFVGHQEAGGFRLMLRVCDATKRQMLQRGRIVQ